MDQQVETGQIPGLVALIAHQGDTHVHVAGTKDLKADDAVARDSLFRIASMTKPVAAAAAMMLVDRGVLQLDSPVDDLLPELADRQVLRQLDGLLEDIYPAPRAITLRDLLTLRMGLGHIMARCDDYPIRQALSKNGLLIGFPRPQAVCPPDEWIRRVGTLPLMHAPGEQWMYDLGLDVLGVLLARAAGKPLDVFLHETIFAPLGMVDTAFYVPEEKLPRLTTAYKSGPGDEGLVVYDDRKNSDWATPPDFPAAASGLVSTADDYLAFCRMLLQRGQHKGEEILSPAAVDLMTQDHLTEQQRTSNRIFLGKCSGWGFGMAVNIASNAVQEQVGRFGWDGGLGTSAYTDPKNDLIGILLTQRSMDSPEPPVVFSDFWSTTYRATLES